MHPSEADTDITASHDGEQEEAALDVARAGRRSAVAFEVTDESARVKASPAGYPREFYGDLLARLTLLRPSTGSALRFQSVTSQRVEREPEHSVAAGGRQRRLVLERRQHKTVDHGGDEVGGQPDR